VSRRQLLAAGHTDADIRRMVRRRELTRVHPGVYVDHTGPLTWMQRAWAGVLAVWPAALAAESVVSPGGPVVVAVDRNRRVTRPQGVRVVHVTDLHGLVRWNLGPPRVRFDEAVLDLAAAAPSELAATGVLADAVQSRQTTADRLLAALDQRRRIRRRTFLTAVLRDVRDGTHSALEHGYLTRVERPHGLPVALRQHPGVGLYRDVTYAEGDTYVELDGRTFHDNARSRDADLDRDLDAAADGRETLRLGWGQVFDRPCATAGKVAVVLRARGWTGTFRRCPACPASSSDATPGSRGR